MPQSSHCFLEPEDVTFTLEVKPATSVKELKRKIESKPIGSKLKEEEKRLLLSGLFLSVCTVILVPKFFG
jgi:hypothetical protein